MNRAINFLAKEIFKEPHIFRALGFSQRESELLYKITQGVPMIAIGEQMNISIVEANALKYKCLPLVPLFLHQKLAVLTNVNLTSVYEKLLELNIEINEFIEFYQEVRVYNIRELNLSRRTRNALQAHGIKNTKELIEYALADLVKIKNIGDSAIEELQSELLRLNLKLRE